jgi:hypothetical protein
MCNYCNETDTIQHFILQCFSTKAFWNLFINWWNSLPENTLILTNFNSDNDALLLLFGFHGGTDDARALNVCTGYAKYFIYIHKLNKRTNIDFHIFIIYLKHNLEIEKIIHQKNNNERKFSKLNKILENM